MRTHFILIVFILISCSNESKNESTNKLNIDSVRFNPSLFENEDFYNASLLSKYPVEFLRGNEKSISIAYYNKLEIFNNPLGSDNPLSSLIMKFGNIFNIDSISCYQENVKLTYHPITLKVNNSYIKLLRYPTGDYVIIDALIKDTTLTIAGGYRIGVSKTDFMNSLFKEIPKQFNSVDEINLSRLMDELGVDFIFKQGYLKEIRISRQNPKWIIDCFNK